MKLKTSEQILCLKRLSFLLGAGIPLSQAIETITAQSKKKTKPKKMEKNKIKNPRVVRLSLDSVFNIYSKKQLLVLALPQKEASKFDLRYAVVFIIIVIIKWILIIMLI